MNDIKKSLKKFWHFIWEEDSLASWIVNIVLAFILIKFIVYPGLGFLLSTTHPVVAVVSRSMEHTSSFDDWWQVNGAFYQENFELNKETFSAFSFRNGFNKGDIMVLLGKDPSEIDVGQVIVYSSFRPDPIIHRVVNIWEDNGYHFTTKGDNVPIVQNFEEDINENQVVGRAVLRIPLLGWVKITFVCSIQTVVDSKNFVKCVVE